MDINEIRQKYEPIDGEWYIMEKLGGGSFGDVYRIERRDLSGTYNAAVKIISIPRSKNELDYAYENLQDEHSVTQYFEDLTRKLVSEFNLMSKLKGNSNIVSYEDHKIIKHEHDIGYDVLIRMELLKPLNKLISGMDENAVVKLGIDICKALEICNKSNIVHRDIKPENIFVSDFGDYKLGDFGVAKTMNKSMTFMTTTGTFSYMAPELKKGEQCAENVDIYSLGIVMYKLMNGNRDPFLPLPPQTFTFDQKDEALIRRFSGEALPAPAYASSELSAIILKACEYNPALRYANASEMRSDLEKLSAGIAVPVFAPESTSAANNTQKADDSTVFVYNQNASDKAPKQSEQVIPVYAPAETAASDMEESYDDAYDGTVAMMPSAAFEGADNNKPAAAPVAENNTASDKKSSGKGGTVVIGIVVAVILVALLFVAGLFLLPKLKSDGNSPDEYDEMPIVNGGTDVVLPENNPGNDDEDPGADQNKEDPLNPSKPSKEADQNKEDPLNPSKPSKEHENPGKDKDVENGPDVQNGGNTVKTDNPPSATTTTQTNNKKHAYGKFYLGMTMTEVCNALSSSYAINGSSITVSYPLSSDLDYAITKEGSFQSMIFSFGSSGTLERVELTSIVYDANRVFKDEGFYYGSYIYGITYLDYYTDVVKARYGNGYSYYDGTYTWYNNGTKIEFTRFDKTSRFKLTVSY